MANDKSERCLHFLVSELSMSVQTILMVCFTVRTHVGLQLSGPGTRGFQVKMS